jgi:N-acetylglucosamine-6-sulfatase
MALPRRQKARLTLAACATAIVVGSAASVAGAPAGAAAPGEQATAAVSPCQPGAKQGSCPSKGEKRRERQRKLRRANAKQKRPNVIVIETDDLNLSDMPGLPTVLDKLARLGTSFRNSYASFPLCCPSRATFLTGQYAHNHHVIGSEPATGYNALDHTNTLAVWLRRSGYRTAMVGKYLNGYGLDDGLPELRPDATEVPPGWTEWYALTGGLDQRRYKYWLNENGRLRWYGAGRLENYVTDVLAAKTIDFLRRRARYPKPFFLWFNPTAPHGEAGLPLGATRDPTPAPRHLGLYGNATAPRNPNFNEDDVDDKPDLVSKQPKLGQADIDDIDRRFRGRMESLLSVDEAVGRIIRRLKKARDLRKTYLIFTSDNGIQLGAHRLIFKSYLYEESLRVPLIIRGPKFPAGVVRDQLVANIDLAPTIAQIAKATPGLAMDGIPLLPLALKPAAASGRDLLFESYDFNSFGIRRGNWRYNQYENGDNKEELYDLVADPFELTNLLHPNPNPPASAGIKAQLEARLAQLKACAGASCQ